MAADKTAIRQMMALRAQLSASIAQVDATLTLLGVPERTGDVAETKEDLKVFGRKTIEAPGGDDNG